MNKLNITLRLKIVLLVLFISAFVVFFIFRNLRANYDEFVLARSMKQNAVVFQQASITINNLQTERGLAANYEKNKTDFNKQVKVTDKAVSDLVRLISGRSAFKQYSSLNDRIISLRSSVSSNNDYSFVFNEYTKLIDEVFNIYKIVSNLKTTRGVGKQLTSLTVIELSSENGQRFRAYSIWIYNNKSQLNDKQLSDLLSYKNSMQDNLISPALAMSSDSDKKTREMVETGELSKLDVYYFDIIKNYSTGNYRLDSGSLSDISSNVLNVISSISRNEISLVISRIIKIELEIFNDLIITLISSLFFLAVIFLVAYLITSNIEKSLNRVIVGISENSEMITKSAIDMNYLAGGLNDSASNLASTIEEITATVEEIAATFTHTAQNIGETEKITNATNLSAEETAVFMDNLFKKLCDIIESNKKVSGIIKVIDDIAFQTNILSLNASVEAARVGEHGKGFMVVAEQVKTLSEKSANAAKVSEELINQSGNDISSGRDIAEKTQSLQSGVKSYTEKLKLVISEINHNSSEQVRGLNQISAAISELNSVATDNSSKAENTLSMSGIFTEQSDKLQESVKLLETIIGKKRV